MKMMKLQQELPKSWNLENIFAGGSRSEELAVFLDRLEADISSFQAELGAVEVPQSEADLHRWEKIVEQVNDLSGRLEEVSEYSICISSVNTKDEGAASIEDRVAQLGAQLEAALIRFDAQIASFSDELWQKLVALKSVAEVQFGLEERRNRVQEMLSESEETLIASLGVDGLKAWERFFEKVIARVRIPFEKDGKLEEHSLSTIGQFFISADADVRRRAFQQSTEVMAGEAELCAQALNALGGYRLQTYKARGWDSFLHESLLQNRLSEATLTTMWGAVEKIFGRLAAYLERRGKVIGVESLHFVDLYAPIGKGARTMSWEEGAEIIVEQFATVSPKMAELARRAFEEGWIDWQQSAVKAPVGFCASFPVTKESRILGTFHGRLSDVACLIAHELGHAFHFSAIKDLPRLAQLYSKSTAETASTFAERLVMDALLQKVDDREERIALLGSKLDNAVLYCMFTYMGFLFEKSFYEERAQGLVSVERLNELMLQAQQRAFANSFTGYVPIQWSFHGHYYDTVNSFYNYPYAFGALFSAGIYAMALREGAAFEAKYIALLRDTGRMKVEELAAKHLGVDLTQEAFWLDALQIMTGDLEEFLQLTE